MSTFGPLAGISVVHLASLGPGPYGVMLLADLGADVTVVDRASGLHGSMPPASDPRRRGQRSIAVDLKREEGREVVLDLVRTADVFVEGMRPGVAERLGVGPDDLATVKPNLVYARMTGWGQDGPLAQRAGHDINYVAATGALHAMGDPTAPPPVPLNLLGDYAGGGVFLALGVVAALLKRAATGHGDVVDVAIVDGVRSLTTAMLGMAAAGLWTQRGQNPFDGSRPWYRCYRTSDDRFVAVGAIEANFYDQLLDGLDLDRNQWRRDESLDIGALTRVLEERFASADRDHWTRVFAESDACVSPVLSLDEALVSPAARQRNAYIEVAGVVQPAPAPRLSSSTASLLTSPPAEGRNSVDILRQLGRTDSQICELLAARVVVQEGTNESA